MIVTVERSFTDIQLHWVKSELFSSANGTAMPQIKMNPFR